MFNVYENGGNVQVVGLGSMNTANLTFLQGENPLQRSVIGGEYANLALGLQDSVVDLFEGGSGPSSFGPGFGENFTANIAIGDPFGIAGQADLLFLPSNYTSGTVISNAATFNNATLSSMRLTEGSYIYTFGTNSVTVMIGAVPTVATAAVPEPTTWAMMMLGFGALGYAMRGRSKMATRIRFA